MTEFFLPTRVREVLRAATQVQRKLFRADYSRDSLFSETCFGTDTECVLRN